ncbi:MAG: hypothetical protein R3Y59_09800 [bacterium]
MARTTSREVLEEKILKAQGEVVKSKKRYDAATATLKELLDKRELLQTEELMSAVAKSKRSYEEILKFLNDENSEEE